MKRYWKILASWIDERATRERALLFLCAIAVTYVLLQALLLAPVMAERKRSLQGTLSDHEDIRKMTEQVQIIVRARAVDPNAPLRAMLAELESRMSELQRQTDAQSAELVPADRMAAVLEKILANSPRLQMIEVKTLPRASMSIEREPAKAEPRQPREATRESVEEKKSSEIYKHGVEVTMRGNYLDLLAYLKQIESLPVRMFWDKLSLSVTEYPTITMRLTVYTISLERVWLTV